LLRETDDLRITQVRPAHSRPSPRGDSDQRARVERRDEYAQRDFERARGARSRLVVIAALLDPRPAAALEYAVRLERLAARYATTASGDAHLLREAEDLGGVEGLINDPGFATRATTSTSCAWRAAAARRQRLGLPTLGVRDTQIPQHIATQYWVAIGARDRRARCTASSPRACRCR
jgi:3-deoxy-D-arabino-heptulosonate 7-phosphate (DAHP) synthase